MISLEMFLLWVLMMGGVGGFLAWRYATEEYGKGFFDALMLHHSGQLTYEAYEEEDGTPALNVHIKGKKL